jgi:hypothetical protein
MDDAAFEFTPIKHDRDYTLFWWEIPEFNWRAHVYWEGDPTDIRLALGSNWQEGGPYGGTDIYDTDTSVRDELEAYKLILKAVLEERERRHG